MAATISLMLGILGNVISILVFSSPLPTFWHIFKIKSTENFRGLPYVCTLLSTSLWSYYGIIKPGGTLILTINAAGTAFQSFYIILFFIYAPKARKLRTALLAFLLNVVCFGLLLVLTMTLSDGQRRIFVVGAICSVISVSMYAAPLGIMRTVIRTKSVEFMPFFLSLFLFLNGAVWSTYALLVKDVFVEIPNAIGFLLGAVQLSLYAYYRNGKPTDDEKEGTSASRTSRDNADLEMGRSASLPEQFSLPKQGSLPKIYRTSSAKVVDFLNSMQENELSGQHEGKSKLITNALDSSP